MSQQNQIIEDKQVCKCGNDSFTVTQQYIVMNIAQVNYKTILICVKCNIEIIINDDS